VILRHQSQWSTFHSFIHVCPQKETLLHTYGEKNLRSPSTEPHADGRPTCNGVRAGSSRVLLRHCNLYPSSMLPSHDTFHLGLGRPEPSMCRGNPYQVIPSTTVTTSHETQGRAEYECTIPRGTDEGLDLWEVAVQKNSCIHSSPSSLNEDEWPASEFD